MNEKFLIRFVTFTPLVILPAIAIAVSLMTIHHDHEILEKSIQNIRERLISEQQKSIVSKINMAIELILYQRSTIEKRLQVKVKNRVDTAYVVAKNIYEQNKYTKSEAEIKQMIIDALRPMIWNGGESFIFILDKQGIFALAPEYLRHMEGKSIIDFKDVAGRYVIKEEINKVNTKGDGYLWDTFTRPNHDPKIQYKQLAYVKDVGYFDWYMGSTEYLDTTTREIENTSVDILRNINKNATHYFFIVDKNGNDILHPSNPEYEGKNLYKVASKTHKKVFQQILDNVKKHSTKFIQYRWKNPVTKKIETKLTYATMIPNSELIIGTGFYIEEIDQIVEAKKKDLIALNQHKMNQIFVISSIISIFSILISLFISMRLKRHFEMLHSNIERSNRDLLEFNTSLEEKIAIRTEELKNARDDMEKLAMTDTLTGIHNRYAFFRMLEMEENKTKRYQSQFSLMMFDLDNFKTINDTYGHDIGDDVLMKVVHLTGQCLRPSDIFGRAGGEEFMILLPNTNLDNSVEIAQRLREKISHECIEPVGGVTVSIGVVEYRLNEDEKSFIKRVDIALYRAKELGRNRVEIG